MLRYAHISPLIIFDIPSFKGVLEMVYLCCSFYSADILFYLCANPSELIKCVLWPIFSQGYGVTFSFLTVKRKSHIINYLLTLLAWSVRRKYQTSVLAVRAVHDRESILYADLWNISMWLGQNRLTLNISKSKFMLIDSTLKLKLDSMSFDLAPVHMKRIEWSIRSTTRVDCHIKSAGLTW